MAQWTFITNHGAVLALIAEYGQITAREISIKLDLAERSVHRIICELESEGYVSKEKQGRVNHYRVRQQLPMRTPDRGDVAVAALLRVLNEEPTLDESGE